tara:strand:+ start:475 stop:1098 length:624 start_codon:yes stop_codon:yes gene_type:complete
MSGNNKEYSWQHNQADNSFNYLQKTINHIIENKIENKTTLVDVGCGNGYLTKKISNKFLKVTALDESESAIYQAKKDYTGKIKFLQTNLNNFKDEKKIDCITAIEVIEHTYSPDNFLKKLYELSDKDTKVIISTPYHGFLKNLLLLLTGKFDKHFSPLWEHGHIKFFSKKTLYEITKRNKFRIVETFFSGRFYPISKSIIVVLKKIT